MELKPCPFCGCKPISDGCYTRDQSGRWGATQCPDCLALGPEVRAPYGSVEWHKDAGTEWNRRATPAPAKSDDVETCNVTGNEWTRFIPRARAWFDDNGEPAMETEINDLACLLQSVATETRAEERERWAQMVYSRGDVIAKKAASRPHETEAHKEWLRMANEIYSIAAAIRKGEAVKPLAEIVAEIEVELKNACDPSEEIHLDQRADTWARLCQAFRAAEKMRESCYADNSGGEYRRRCADCDTDIYSEHAADCSFAAWDRVTGGNDE